MKVHETETIIIRGKRDNVFKRATKILEKLYPRINESLRTQFLGFEQRKDFGNSYLAVLYERDYDETLRGGKTTGKYVTDAMQVFCTGKLWKAVLTIPKWRLKGVKE
jgi:hypothetical protein